MIAKFASTLRRWTGRSEAEEAVQPVIAGYHRTPRRLFVILGFIVLAASCVAYGWAFGANAPARLTPFAIPMVILGALILWCLPHGNYAPTKAIEPLFVAFFAALFLWPNYLAIAIGSLPWITMIRLTGVPLILVFLACISISAAFRRELWAILSTELGVLKLVGALAGLWTFSILLSSDPGQTVKHYALVIVNLIGIFFVSAYLFSRQGFADIWVRILLVMLAITCAVAIWESRLQVTPWAGHIPSFLKIDDPVVQKIISGGIGRTMIYRVKAMATTALGLGELLGLAMPFAMHFAFGRYPLWLRAAAGLLVPIMGYVILLTDSRLGFVAGCASLLFYCFFWAMLRWRQVKTSLIAPAIVLAYPAFFAAFMAATFLVDRLRHEFWGNSQQQYSTQGRIDQWEKGIPIILKHPLGQGVGQGAAALGFTNLGGTLTIDSYWLSVLLEIGLAGFIVFYGLILRGSYVAARTVVMVGNRGELGLLLPMAVALLNFVIVKLVFSQDANHPLAFMILGAVVGLNYQARQQLAAPAPDPAWRPQAAGKPPRA
jgi:hypothetical protein